MVWSSVSVSPSRRPTLSTEILVGLRNKASNSPSPCVRPVKKAIGSSAAVLRAGGVALVATPCRLNASAKLTNRENIAAIARP
jgi:hypothetical protein